MGVRHKFNVLPSLLPGEKVLFFKKWVWGASVKSLPTYRDFFSLPPLWEAGLYVTDRRVLLVAHLVRLLTQEVSQWFEGKQDPEDDETIKEVRVGKGALAGPYLEVVSESEVKRWYRSPRFRLRLFMRNPEFLYRLLSETMMKSGSDAAAS